jgi:hypothetical protein
MNLFSRRLQKAQEYLGILEVSLRTEWLAFYRTAIDHPTWVYRLAAIHPRHYRDYVGTDREPCSIRGSRGMTLDGGVRAQGCQCKLIWGYACGLSQERLEADHLFPYSFGGPSIGPNKVVLCNLHNQAKGSDVHLFPWELGEPKWLSEVLQRVNRRMVPPV